MTKKIYYSFIEMIAIMYEENYWRRNAFAFVASFGVVMGSVLLFGEIIRAGESELPTGNEFLTSASVGMLLLSLLLVLIRPRWWAAIAALFIYCILILPVSFAYGCGVWGECI